MKMRPAKKSEQRSSLSTWDEFGRLMSYSLRAQPAAADQFLNRELSPNRSRSGTANRAKATTVYSANTWTMRWLRFSWTNRISTKTIKSRIWWGSASCSSWNVRSWRRSSSPRSPWGTSRIRPINWRLSVIWPKAYWPRPQIEFN